MRLPGMTTAAAALLLAGCATTPSSPAGSVAAGGQLTYRTLPCHGFCPVYTVQIDRNGQGVFTGAEHSAVTGERRFTATPAQTAEFFRRLQPYRPAGELVLDGQEKCASYATDLPGADVTWTDAGGRAHLTYNYGCDREKHRAMADALRSAPDALPIADLIGKR
ncbi:DUF6438 domain-containing protein [Sphingomonas hylomeconis]|uniref:DUF6438 domain-containing protein n=1 Tax=Sphingomonas hylomeconis TaxID=1395958 RepID=A0ABV7SR08_9SPHN|nr:DUF6438 domain-containing protein [Sphingomonas hylomeconis]